MPRAITALKATGMPGRAALGCGIAWCRWAPITLTWSPVYGGDPVRHSYSTQARA